MAHYFFSFSKFKILAHVFFNCQCSHQTSKPWLTFFSSANIFPDQKILAQEFPAPRFSQASKPWLTFSHTRFLQQSRKSKFLAQEFPDPTGDFMKLQKLGSLNSLPRNFSTRFPLVAIYSNLLQIIQTSFYNVAGDSNK